MDSLREANYKGPLSFEVGWQYKDDIKKYTNIEYLNELKNRAEKLLLL